MRAPTRRSRLAEAAVCAARLGAWLVLTLRRLEMWPPEIVAGQSLPMLLRPMPQMAIAALPMRQATLGTVVRAAQGCVPHLRR
eukprot:scaffold333145_cov13-Prasinocladus_malaysianus.AAC.1